MGRKYKKLNKIAELIVDYYKSRYWHHEILELGEDLIEVDFYSHDAPEIGYVIGYVGKKIEINYIDEIKLEDPELYQMITDVIDESEKRPYNARPVARTEKEKDARFFELVTEINNRGTGERRLDDLLAFLKSNLSYRGTVMFRQVRK